MQTIGSTASGSGLWHNDNPHARSQMGETPGGKLCLGDGRVHGECAMRECRLFPNVLFQRGNRYVRLLLGGFVE